MPQISNFVKLSFDFRIQETQLRKKLSWAKFDSLSKTLSIYGAY